MIQRYIIINKPSATVTVDGIAEGKAIAVKWCKAEDVAEMEAVHCKLLEAHEIALEALKYIAKLYDDSKPVYQVAYDAYAMKSEAATALERINEMMP